GAGGDDRRGDDDGGGVGGDVDAPVHGECDSGAVRLGFDLLDPADRHAQDHHVVADEDPVAVLEVGHHPDRGRACDAPEGDTAAGTDEDEYGGEHDSCAA